MSYKQKTWTDRVSESPNRRTLTIESQTDAAIVATVQRTEGEISKEGDAFNAENMNDLESRIAAGLEEKLDGQKLESDTAVILSKVSADGSAPDCYAIKLLYDELKKLVADGKKLIADAISAQGITTAGSDMTFTELADAIKTTGNTRYSNGYNAGYTKGNKDGTASGQTSGYNTGYAAGKADGISYADGRTNSSSASYTAGYNAGYSKGVTAADARTNTSSASYKSGYSAGVTAADARVSTSSKSYTSGYSAGKKAAAASIDMGKLKASKENDNGSSRVSAEFACYPKATLANGTLTLTVYGYASADMAYKNDHDLSTTATLASTSKSVSVS